MGCVFCHDKENNLEPGGSRWERRDVAYRKGRKEVNSQLKGKGYFVVCVFHNDKEEIRDQDVAYREAGGGGLQVGNLRGMYDSGGEL